MHADHDPVAGTLAEIHEGEPHGPVLVREGKAAGIRAHDDLLVGEADAPVSGASSPSSIRNGRAPPAAVTPPWAGNQEVPCWFPCRTHQPGVRPWPTRTRPRVRAILVLARSEEHTSELPSLMRIS